MASNTNIGVAIVLAARNQASQVINDFVGRAQSKMQQLGKATAKVGEGIAEMMAANKGREKIKETLDAYGEMESAGNMLKANMMQKGGVFDTAMYDRLFEYSKKLSAANTGSTASYLDMIRVMKQNRIAPGEVLGGIGADAAMLAHYFDNMLPAATAEFAAHMKNDMGVAVKDMYKVMDLTARIHDVGVGKTGQEAVDEMNQYFSKVGLGLANLHATGIEEAKKAGALGAIFMARGISGQSVGTNFRRIFDGIGSAEKIQKANEAAALFHKHLDFFSKDGKFLGVENFVQQIGKLQGLHPAAIEAILKPFSGKQGLSTDFMQFLANEGLKDYPEMVRRIEEQASLKEKIGAVMEGQKLQEAVLASNVTNTKASFGKSISEQYKGYLAVLNKYTVALGNFFDKHQRFAKITADVVLFVSAAVALKGVITIFKGLSTISKLLGVAGPITMVANAFKYLKFALWAVRFHFVTGLVPALNAAWAVMLANPIGLIIAGVVALAAAVYLIIRNWTKVKAFFVDLWGNIKKIFSAVGQWMKAEIIKISPQWLLNAWIPVKGFFAGVWSAVSTVFKAGYNAVSFIFMNLTPVGWVIKYWKPMGTFFKGVWELVSAVFKAGVYAAGYVIMNFTPIGWIVKHWKPITAAFKVIWNGVKAVFSAGVSAIKWVLLNMTPAGLIYNHWRGITGFFTMIWNSVKVPFMAVLKWVYNFGKNFFNAGANIITNIVDGIFSKIGKIGEAMSNVAQKIRSYLPYSPAKNGALKDIHRIKLIETIAESIRPGVLLRKVAGVMASVAAIFATPVHSISMPAMLPKMEMPSFAKAMEGRKIPPVVIKGVWDIAPPSFPKGEDVLRKYSALNLVLQRPELPKLNYIMPSQLAVPVMPHVKMPDERGLGFMKDIPGKGLPSGPGGFKFEVNITLNGSATEKDAKMVGDNLEQRMDMWYAKMKRNLDRVKY